MPLTNIFNHVLENLCFQEHKSGIRRKHEEYADEVAEDRVLRNTCKRGPHIRANRLTRSRHRHPSIRAHQAVTQRKAVAGGQGRQSGAGRPMGSAKPGQAPVQVRFGEKHDLILLKSVASVSIEGDGGN